jgi:outer membrane protein assembly factor BamB
MQKVIFLVVLLLNITCYAQLSFTSQRQEGKADRQYSQFGDIRWIFKTEGKVFSSPALSNGVLFVGSEDQFIYAIDERTGKLIWKVKTGGAVSSSPTIYKEVVYVASRDGYFYALNAKTGKEIWKYKTDGEMHAGGIGYWGMQPHDQFLSDPFDIFLSSSCVERNNNNPLIYFGSGDGNVYALNAATGLLKWKFKTKGVVHSSPALWNDMLYVGSWDANLYALDAKTGNEKWRFKTNADSVYHQMEGIQASPVVHNGIVYVGARDANFYAVDALNGKLKWKYSTQPAWVVSSAFVNNNEVIFGSSDSFQVLALERLTGVEKYKFNTQGYIFSSPISVGNAIIAGDFTGKLFLFDSHRKEINSFATTGRREKASSVLKDDKLDFGFAAEGKDLYQYQNNMYALEKIYSLGSFVSTPVVHNDTLFIGSADGNVYAVGLK